MQLVQRNTDFWRWYWRIFAVLLRRRCGATLSVVGLSVVSIMSNLMAFMLPLKVIILAASDGVPRYFQFLIAPEDKWPWIIGLTIGAIVCYIINIICDSIIERVSARAGAELMQQANELVVVADQDAVVGNLYGKLCGVQASIWFCGLSILALIGLHPIALVSLLVLIGLQFFFAVWVVSGDDEVNPSRLKQMLLHNTREFVAIQSNSSFLVIFLVILIPYIMGVGGNFLLSLVAFLLARRLLSIMAQGIISAVSLAQARNTVNALLFREHQVIEVEQKGKALLRTVFSKARRTALVAESLRASLMHEAADATHTDALEVCWQDSSLSGVSTLVVSPPDYWQTTADSHFQVQVYPRNRAHVLSNEERLFLSVSRQCLLAPEVLARFQEGEFACQIIAYGKGQALASAEWAQQESIILARLWTCKPPLALREAYALSQQSLDQRLHKEFIERTDVAVDTAAEAATMQGFLRVSRQLEQDLSSYPVVIHNPAFNINNVVQRLDDSVAVVAWGQWSLEPMGVVLPKSKVRPTLKPKALAAALAKEDEVLTAMLDTVKAQRDDVPATFSPHHLRLARMAWQLETHINKGAYKAALATMADIVAWYATPAPTP